MASSKETVPTNTHVITKSKRKLYINETSAVYIPHLVEGKNEAAEGEMLD